MAVTPWRSIATVTAITVVGLAALAFGQPFLAAAAGGALFSYLGRLNGAKAANTAS